MATTEEVLADMSREELAGSVRVTMLHVKRLRNEVAELEEKGVKASWWTTPEALLLKHMRAELQGSLRVIIAEWRRLKDERNGVDALGIPLMSVAETEAARTRTD